MAFRSDRAEEFQARPDLLLQMLAGTGPTVHARRGFSGGDGSECSALCRRHDAADAEV